MELAGTNQIPLDPDFIEITRSVDAAASAITSIDQGRRTR